MILNKVCDVQQLDEFIYNQCTLFISTHVVLTDKLLLVSLPSDKKSY